MKAIKEKLQKTGELAHEDMDKILVTLRGKDAKAREEATDIVATIFAKLKKGRVLE